MTDDIIDRIDEQLAAGEKPGATEVCWHCNRSWHGLPVTERIANMYAKGLFDETYRVDTDTSRVLCPGDDFIGPLPADAVVAPPDLLIIQQMIGDIFTSATGLLGVGSLREFTDSMSQLIMYAEQHYELGEQHLAQLIRKTRRLVWSSYASLAIGVLMPPWILYHAIGQFHQNRWGFLALSLITLPLNYWTVKWGIRNVRINRTQLAELKAQVS